MQTPYDAAWRGHEQSGPPLPSIDARPQRPTGVPIERCVLDGVGPTGASVEKAAEPHSHGDTLRHFAIRFPASSANLGSAFDAAALALDLYLEVKAEPAQHFAVHASGRDSEVCGKLDRHLILEVYRSILQREGKAVTPLRLELANQIPIGKGCGSSAAARLAGLALAVYFGQLDWPSERVLEEACHLEGHPDNVAACWLGGIAVAREIQDGVDAVRLLPAKSWSFLLAVPDVALPTEEARKVLPAQYSRADAVSGIQNGLIFIAGLVAGRGEVLFASAEDRIHQPYRARLCPLLDVLLALPLAGYKGVFTAALSGAGPSVLMVLDPAVPVEQTKARIRKLIEEKKIVAELIETRIAETGAGTEFARLCEHK